MYLEPPLIESNIKDSVDLWFFIISFFFNVQNV